MLDFIKISDKNRKNGRLIRPEFCTDIVPTDLMIKGHAFYAIWDEENHKWCKRKSDVSRLIDKDVRAYINSKDEEYMRGAEVKWAKEDSSGIMMAFVTFCKHIADDVFVPLDNKIILKSDPYLKENYSTYRLNYDIAKGECPYYHKLITTLYDNEEREKIEWIVGAILNGDGPKIQKFLVFYGDRGTGKSTVISIITEKLFKGYCSSFDAADLASSSKSFSMEPFKDNPIIAYQHDGNLSRIETNTKLNSIISHEIQPINEKNKSIYQMRITSVLIMGSNDKVRITNAKSGLLRRLLDVNPSGRLLNPDTYEECMNGIDFELGAIAYRCLMFYRQNRHKYDSYIPMEMMAGTNDFFDFVSSYYDEFIRDEETDGYSTLSVAWSRYKNYVDDAAVKNQMNRRAFADELNNYFKEGLHDEYVKNEEGKKIHLRSIYRGFKKDFMYVNKNVGVQKSEKAIDNEITSDTNDDGRKDVYSNIPDWLHLSEANENIEMLKKNPLNVYLKDAFAQYSIESAGGSSQPKKPWNNVTMKLSNVDTTREHYILTQSVDPKLICIDFDLKDPETGGKSLERNLLAAKMFPPTYTETSKSGNGLHLYYIYDGDPEELSMVFDKEIEIKVFRGKSALRRKLYLCNNEAIAHINSGLPLKEVNKKMIDWEGVQNEKHLRALIKKGLQRKVFANTKPSIDYISHVLNEAYDSGISYNVSDLQPRVLNMAYGSTHNADYCVEKILSCEFMSEDNKGKENSEFKETRSNSKSYDELPITFYDVEVFPNLFILCYKEQDDSVGAEAKEKVVRVINPSSNYISEFAKTHKLVGFNNLDYDNNIMYARILGYSNRELYSLSKSLIQDKKSKNGDKSRNYGFREARNISYTDVYDFSNDKKKLKKWEIELGIHHQEFGYSWDEEVPNDIWEEAADYCANDVIATEAVWNYKSIRADWFARQVLSKLSGLSVNDKTNAHTCRIIFGTNKHPQTSFNYPDLSKEFPGYEFCSTGIPKERYNIGFNGKSVMTSGKSIYLGDDPSEGGYVYYETGIHRNVALLDVASLHPTTIEAIQLFGPVYTARFSEIKKARVALKHKKWDEARGYLDGALIPFLEGIENKSEDEQQAFSDSLSYAYKIVINSIYGMTSASYPNPCKDPRNIENIVAKRGALFMILLKHTVQDMGYTVAHVKTDSIKIANADEKIISFVMDFGKKYGYTFEHEATYEKLCLANKSSYVAKYDAFGERTKGGRHARQWTVTGDTFMHPYLFKTLFSHEDITLDDYCETKTVSGDAKIYIDKNERLVSDLNTKLYLLKEQLANAEYGKAELRREIKNLQEEIDSKHDMTFIGKCGMFIPVKDGANGGYLLRIDGEKQGAVAGTKGYRWLEREEVDKDNKWDMLDITYFRKLVDGAYKEISKYGDADEFING